MKIHRYLYKQIVYCAVMLIVAGIFVLPAHTQNQNPSATFVAYDCVYIPETDTVQIPAVLIGADGEVIPLEDYTVLVDVPNNEQNVFEGRVSVTPLAQRPPLQMVMVLDVTETVPLQRLIVELQGQFFSQLNPEDEIALITFGNTISPITQFYVDKGRLFNEQFLNLTTQVGDNRMYDAIRDAVINMPMNVGQRQVVLVITDSRPREDQIPPQTPLEDIIDEAVDNGIQIYTLGYYSRDLPDEEGLLQISLDTDGYAWFSRDNSTIENIERGIIEQLNNVAQGLNSEVMLEIPLAGVTPDVNNQVRLDLSVDLLSDPTLTDSVNCIVERANNHIAFIDMSDTLRVQGGTVEIGVTVESDLSGGERRIVFFLNDEIEQNTNSEIFTFDASRVDPGLYTLRAELRDTSDETLDSTETVTIFAQRLLQLSGRQNEQDDVVFEAFVNNTINLPSPAPNVQFYVAVPADPNTRVPLVDFTLPFVNGRARLAFPIAEAESRFNGLPFSVNSGDTVLITAEIANPVEGEFELALSNALEYVIPDFPQPEVILPEIVIPQEEDDVNRGLVLFISSLVFFGVLNILFFRQISRERIKRMIRNPDRYDLDDRLMTITIQRDGMRQSYRLTKKTVGIGRGSMNDINLGGDADISRQHGVIMWRKQGWYYSNRKRQVAARIDGKWYKGYVFKKLEPITNIEIGSTHLVFHSSAQQDISEFISTNI